MRKSKTIEEYRRQGGLDRMAITNTDKDTFGKVFHDSYTGVTCMKLVGM